MCRVRWMAVLTACLFFLGGCGSQQASSEALLYKGEETGGESEPYKTTEVKLGTYEEKVSATGELYYPDENDVTIDEENAYLDKICVKNKQRVQKGDVVAIYHIKTSQASLQKKKLQVQQARGQYDSGLKSKRNEILAKEKSIDDLTSESEKKLARIELKKMRKEYSQMVNEGSEIRKQEKEYDTLVRRQSKTELKAKFSGVICDVVSVAEFEDDTVTGEKLMKIRNDKDYLIRVEEGTKGLRYNMQVDVGLGPTSEQIKYRLKGKVISTDNLQGGSAEDEESDNTMPLIRLSKEDMEKYPVSKYNIYVSGVTLRIKNAFIVDAEAVYEEVQNEETKLYVMLVENEKLHKRYIVSNYKQDSSYLVNQGVEEGQKLAILKID